MRIFGLDIRRSRDLAEAAKEEPLRARLQRLEIALVELQEHHVALHGAHAKLRNKVYGDQGGRPASKPEQLSLDRIPRGDKESLRKALGVVPGARYQHQE